MKYELQYHEKVINEDIPKLSVEIRNLIKISVEKKLLSSPETFGKPLRKSLKGYRKLRVGDFRVIFRIENSFIKIFMIEHRSVVYRKVDKRAF